MLVDLTALAGKQVRVNLDLLQTIMIQEKVEVQKLSNKARPVFFIVFSFIGIAIPLKNLYLTKEEAEKDIQSICEALGLNVLVPVITVDPTKPKIIN